MGANVKSSDYLAFVREIYEGEVFGEAFLLAILAVADSERDKYHLGTLLQLETETKARLRPFLIKHGLSILEDISLTDIPLIVSSYKQSGLAGIARGGAPIVQNVIVRLKQHVEEGPSEDRPVLEAMIRHEEAILRWMNEEAQGPSDCSLDSIIAELKFPLPPM